jgi:Lon protease-like protein
MVNDALSGDRIIGMVLLKPGFEGDYDGKPPVYHIGCMGLITHVERLEDGRFNLILRGIEKFTIVGEEAPGIDQLYRRAMITPIDETLTAVDRQALGAERKKLETLLTPVFEGTLAQHRLPDAMPDEDLVNSLAQYLDLEPIEKLALLERPGALARCRSLVELLEMKALLKNTSGDAGVIH